MKQEVKWRTAAELAYDWGVSPRSVLRLIQRGDLPAFRVNRRVILISDVDAALYYATQYGGATDTTSNCIR